MKLVKVLLMISLLVFSMSLTLVGGEGDAAEYDYSLWVGAHYTDLQDNAKKVGEYNLGNSEALPELKFDLHALKGDGVYTLKAHYFDHKNINGAFSARKGDQVDIGIRFRSLVHQQGQDLLGNISAREWKQLTADSGAAGGKILTHDITDPEADYNNNRNEILSRMNVLLSRKNNIRLMAAHHSIIEKGEEQKIASTHCFSCHLSSRTVDVKKQTHQVEAGVEAEVGDFDLGYLFGYRKFKSDAGDATVYYDSAAHPVSGGSGGEFGSRVIYEDTTIAFGVYPETEKMSHRVKLNGDVGSGRLASTFGYSKVENKKSALTASAVTGAVRYTAPLSNRTRLVAKASAIRQTTDETAVDLPTWREASGPVDFDFVRYSSLDRLDSRASAEIISRLNPRTTLSILAGYRQITRDDYPEIGADASTSKIIGQAKLRYRRGLKFNGSLKYRFEKTSDPFTSGKGLFESRGRETLEETWSDKSFYYQREDLRYQNITTSPTDYHQVVLKSTIRPNPKYSFNLGLRVTSDKNGDLDSLDVKHLSMQPNLGMTLVPNPKWSFATGYTHDYSKSRGPVSVALFDG